MDEAEVLYNIKFTRGRGNTDVTTPSDEPTYCNINYSKAQRPASSRRSGVTWERVALLLLSVLLAAALTALGVTLHEDIHTIKSLQKFQEECEAKHLSGNLSGIEPCKVEQPCKPPSVRDETCPRCDDGWEPHGGKCYFFSSDKLTWTQSRTQCISMRGDLVVIKSREELEFLQSRVMEKMSNPDDKFWIGLTDSKNEGEWLWVDDTRLTTSLKFWRHYEPDNGKEQNLDGENCVIMGEEYLMSWIDKSCISSLKSICEKPEESCG